MKLVLWLSACAVFVGGSSLMQAAGAKAPASVSNMAVLFDRGLEGKNQDQQNQLNQLGDFFEGYLLAQFNRAGYATTKISVRDQFQAAPGKYLLTVKTVSYNPGSKAARIVVGFGAGATSLNVHFELYGEGAQPLVTKDHGRGSSRDWQFVCRALSKDLVGFVGDALRAR
jgi:hypothetical protein